MKPKLEENPTAAGALLALGGVAALIGALVWAARKKPTPTQPALPAPPPPATEEPAFGGKAVANCAVNPDLVHNWGLYRELSVFYVPASAGPLSWPQMLEIPTTPEILALPGGIDRIVFVDGEKAFWIFTGSPPVPAPAPAARDDYCAWVAAQPQAPVATPPAQQPSFGG